MLQQGQLRKDAQTKTTKSNVKQTDKLGPKAAQSFVILPQGYRKTGIPDERMFGGDTLPDHEVKKPEADSVMFHGGVVRLANHCFPSDGVWSVLTDYTVLHTAECVTRTICFKTSAERDTNKRFDRKRVTKKPDARRSLNRLKRTKPDVDRLTRRQKRAEYKSPVKEKKHHYKTSVHQAVCGNKRNSSKLLVILQKERQRRTKQPDISIRTWTDDFQNVLGNESVQVFSKESTNETCLNHSLELILKQM